jgi:hypothetical protein
MPALVERDELLARLEQARVEGGRPMTTRARAGRQ